MIDKVKEQHERAVADKFIDWYNTKYGTHFQYARRPDPAPDFIYCDGPHEMDLEIVDAYYDQRDAVLLWKTARNVPGAPTSWTGKEPDEALLDGINDAIAHKCLRDYGASCLL